MAPADRSPPAVLSFAERMQRATAAMLLGLLIDAADLATFGPLGLRIGMGVGGVLGWWLGPQLGFRGGKRWLAALLIGVYCSLPTTELVPLATLLAAVTAFAATPDPSERGGPDRDAIAVDDYQSSWDEPGAETADENNQNSRQV